MNCIYCGDVVVIMIVVIVIYFSKRFTTKSAQKISLFFNLFFFNPGPLWPKGTERNTSFQLSFAGDEKNARMKEEKINNNNNVTNYNKDIFRFCCCILFRYVVGAVAAAVVCKQLLWFFCFCLFVCLLIGEPFCNIVANVVKKYDGKVNRNHSKKLHIKE